MKTIQKNIMRILGGIALMTTFGGCAFADDNNVMAKLEQTALATIKLAPHPSSETVASSLQLSTPVWKTVIVHIGDAVLPAYCLGVRCC